MTRTFVVPGWVTTIGSKYSKGSTKDDRFVLGQYNGTFTSRFIDGGKGSKDYLYVPFPSSSLRLRGISGASKSNKYSHYFSIGGYYTQSTEDGSIDETIYLRNIEYLVARDMTLRLTKTGVYKTDWHPEGIRKLYKDPVTGIRSTSGSWSSVSGPNGPAIAFQGDQGDSFVYLPDQSNKLYLDSDQNLVPDVVDQRLQYVGDVKKFDIRKPEFYPGFTLSQSGSWEIDSETQKGYTSWIDGSIAAWIEFL